MADGLNWFVNYSNKIIKEWNKTLKTKTKYKQTTKTDIFGKSSSLFLKRLRLQLLATLFE